MLTVSKAKFRASFIVLLTIFSLSSTMVPTTALDLGAKAKFSGLWQLVVQLRASV